MNKTPRSIRSHIAIFGKRNVGKSSLINAITNQETALVSEYLGTTTDPVYKSMEILPLGPIVLIDTAGIDDVGDLGELRVKRTLEVINKIDLGIVVIDIFGNDYDYELEIINTLKKKNKSYIIVANKIDLIGELKDLSKVFNQEIYQVSSTTKEGISNLKEVIGQSLGNKKIELPIISDLIKPNDVVVLVTPIDSAAPKGRIILPQQQTLREILDTGAIAVVTKETELEETLKRVEPNLVVTDSQAFELVSAITPNKYPLTSFSILFARNKGNLVQLVKEQKL